MSATCPIVECMNCGDPWYIHGDGAGFGMDCGEYDPEPCGERTRRRWRFFGPLMCPRHGKIARHPVLASTDGPTTGGAQDA